MANQLLDWLEVSDREIGRELSDRAAQEMRAQLHSLLGEVASADLLEMLDEILNFKAMANAALIPGSEGQQRLHDKVLATLEDIDARIARIKSDRTADQKNTQSLMSLRRQIEAVAEAAKLWESLDEARRVKTAIRQRAKSVRAILTVLEERRFRELGERKLRTVSAVRLWSQEMMEAFSKVGRVKESLQGSYRTEWELLITKIFPDIGQIFPEKSNFVAKRGRAVEAKFERYLAESLGNNLGVTRAQPRATFQNSIAPVRSDFVTKVNQSSRRGSAPVQIGTEIKLDSKLRSIKLIFTIPNFQSRHLLGVASRLGVLLVKKLGITGTSIKIEDSVGENGAEARLEINSISDKHEDVLGKIHDLLVEQIEKL